jgi:hypothetical protein
MIGISTRAPLFRAMKGLRLGGCVRVQPPHLRNPWPLVTFVDMGDAHFLRLDVDRSGRISSSFGLRVRRRGVASV